MSRMNYTSIIKKCIEAEAIQTSIFHLYALVGANGGNENFDSSLVYKDIDNFEKDLEKIEKTIKSFVK